MPFTLSEQQEGIILTSSGTSLSEVFMDGARALFSLMADAEHLKSTERIKIVIDAKDIPSLFSAWLTELSERSAQYNLLLGECSIASIQKVNDSQYLLTGAAYGEPYNAENSVQKKAIKKIQKAHYEESEDGHSITCTCLLTLA